MIDVASVRQGVPAGVQLSSLQDVVSHARQLLDFIDKWRPLVSCHLVDFYSERLWERLEPGWVTILGSCSTDALKSLIAATPDVTWPASLQELFSVAQRLSLDRRPADQAGWDTEPLNKGLVQQLVPGASQKKQYEVCRTAALVAAVAQKAGARFVVDFGCGQGHLALILALQYGLHVIAIDSNAKLITAATKRYAELRSQLTRTAAGKACLSRTGQHPQGLDTVSSAASAGAPAGQHDGVADIASLPAANKEAAGAISAGGSVPPQATRAGHTAGSLFATVSQLTSDEAMQRLDQLIGEDVPPDLARLLQQGAVLVGLHACGDLTPTLLRVFRGWSPAVALVSIGCCPNLLSEAQPPDTPACNAMTAVSWTSPSPDQCEYETCSSGSGSQHVQHSANPGAQGPGPVWGFPMSAALCNRGFELGRHAKMLACQSAERMSSAGSPAALEATLTSHIHRAGLELIMHKWYAEVDARVLRVRQTRKRRTTSSRRANVQQQQPCYAAPQPLAAVQLVADTGMQREEPVDATSDSTASLRPEADRQQQPPQTEPQHLQNAPSAAHTQHSHPGLQPQSCAPGEEPLDASSSMAPQISCEALHLSAAEAAPHAPAFASSQPHNSTPSTCQPGTPQALPQASMAVPALSAAEGFAAYVAAALQAADLPERCTHAQLEQVWDEDIEPRCPAFRTLWLLRQVLAPVLETVITIDRLLYVLEGAKQHRLASGNTTSAAHMLGASSKGSMGSKPMILSTVITAIFDPALSPRNIAIVAVPVLC